MKDTGHADPHIWMIRTSDNVLSGPYTQEQLIQLVEEEKLELTDEICRGDSYWIYLHEEQEVKKHLGIEVPAALVEPEEPTQTETDSIISRRADPAQVAAMNARTQRTSEARVEAKVEPRSEAKVQAKVEAKLESKVEASKEYTPVVEKEETTDDIPELPVPVESVDDHTAVLNNRAFREFRPRDQQTPAPAAVTATPVSSSPSGSLTDAVPQSIVSPQTVTVSPSAVSTSFDEVDSKKRFWTLTGVVLSVGAVVIFFAWKLLHA